MRLLGGEVGLRVARAHRQTPETQAAQQLADAALMQLDIELARDLLAQIDHSPTDNTVDPLVRTGAHPLRHRRLLLYRQLRRRTAAMRAVEQAGQAFGVVAMHPVAQRLPIHPALTRRCLAALAF